MANRQESFAQTEMTPQIDRIANELHEAIRTYQVDDTHCHASPEKYGQITVREFLFSLSLAAMPQASYFPAGVLQRWRDATGNERAALDSQYGIEKKLEEMAFHERESIFLKFLTKELAGFLKCAPKLETVVAARNERALGRYEHYIGDLFRDVHLTNAMVDRVLRGLGRGSFRQLCRSDSSLHHAGHLPSGVHSESLVPSRHSV